MGREADQTDRKLRGLDGAAGRAARGLAGLGKGIALGGLGAAAVGVGALGTALFKGFEDAAALETKLAATAAVIKSTGGVAGVTKDSVRDLADELESLSGIDGDAILGAQNILLTFTKVRNGTGATAKVFDMATRSAVDMAAALGQDPANAAMQLGKALNDPIKGVSALGRAGVSFTQDQKDMIKSLTDSNKVMDAQKIILGEMQVQFGGAAKAAGSGFAGSIARAKDSVGDLFRDLATPLLPVVTRELDEFAATVNDRWAPSIGKFAEEFAAGTGEGGKFRDRAGEVATQLGDVAQTAGRGLEELGKLVGWMSENEGKVKTFGAALGGTYLAVKGMAAVSAVKAAAPIAAAGTAALVANPYLIPAAAALGSIYGFMKLISKMDNSENSKRNTLAGAPTVGLTLPKPSDTITLNGVTVPRTNNGMVVQPRALGGPVAAGRPYLVGERGPELFRPSLRGDILSAQRTREVMAAPTPTGPAQPLTVVVQLHNGKELTRVVLDDIKAQAARR